MTAQEAIALAFSFADGMRDTGTSVEAQAAAFVTHLARNGFVVGPRVGGQGSRPRKLPSGSGMLTGAEVRVARGALGISRAKLAEMAGVAHDTLMDFENAQKVPQQRTLDAIRAALELADRAASSPSRSDSP